MLEKIPTSEDMTALIGQTLYAAWGRFCTAIEGKYDMDRLWNSGGNKWDYEYKYRKGGKTLCALYAKEMCIGLLIIFGRDEREKVDAIRGTLSPVTLEVYDSATTYHDGKWVMFDERLPFADLYALLAIKRKPNRKTI